MPQSKMTTNGQHHSSELIITRRATVEDAVIARDLLNEYFNAVDVTHRDTTEAIEAFLQGQEDENERSAIQGTSEHDGEMDKGDPLASVTPIRSALFITFVNSAPAGCIVIRPLTIPEPYASEVLKKDTTETSHSALSRLGECKRLYVRPSYRRKGIAELLLKEMEAYAVKETQSPIEWIYLDTKDDLTSAIKFYAKMGYVPCPRYNENSQATQFYRKKLQ